MVAGHDPPIKAFKNGLDPRDLLLLQEELKLSLVDEYKNSVTLASSHFFLYARVVQADHISQGNGSEIFFDVRFTFNDDAKRAQKVFLHVNFIFLKIKPFNDT